jgi:hypothetical protein
MKTEDELKAELEAELEVLRSEMGLLMDERVGSPEVKEWLERVLAIKNKLNKKAH